MAIDDDGSSEIEPVGDGAPPWDVFKLLDKSGVPFTVIRNAVVAIGKGLTGIVVAGEDVPRAWLQGASAGIRDRTAGRGAVAKAAAASAAKAFSADDALTQRAIEYFGANIILESADFRRGFSAMCLGGTSRRCRGPAFLR
ncbi:hypothetical protein SAMN05414139_03292 [Burkholderia sp. D7]|nr:hypothetical protein SAMN05414139_03292 [Burkholderia sp. D7]